MSNQRKASKPATPQIRVLGVVTEANEDPDLVLFRGERVNDGLLVTFHLRGAAAGQMVAKLDAGYTVLVEITNS